MSEVMTQALETVEADDVEREATTTVLVRRRSERGMVSAEWAVGLIAAIAIAGVLVAVVTTGAVKEGILRFILLVIGAFTNHLRGV